MSLDFRILKEKTFSTQYAALSVDEHSHIMEIVDKFNLPLLSRIKDYYAQGIVYKQNELSDMINEVDEVLKVLKDENVKTKLNDLKAIINLAIEECKPIEALPD